MTTISYLPNNGVSVHDVLMESHSSSGIPQGFKSSRRLGLIARSQPLGYFIASDDTKRYLPYPSVVQDMNCQGGSSLWQGCKTNGS